MIIIIIFIFLTKKETESLESRVDFLLKVG